MSYIILEGIIQPFAGTWKCYTQNSAECSFPFLYDDRKYFGCIKIDGASSCAIDTNQNSSEPDDNYKSIGLCRSDCPGG